MISKSLSTSRKFADLAAAGDLTEFCQVLFPLLVAHADDYGRLSGDAFTVKFQVFPTSPRPVEDFERALDGLAASGLVVRYDADGEKCLQILKFDGHQVGLHKRTASKIPEPPGPSGKFREIPGQLKRTKENLSTSTGASRQPVENSKSQPHDPTPATFALACVVMREALESSETLDHDVSLSNAGEHFKTLCAQRGLAYDADLVRIAYDAVTARRRA